jgi:ADP-ribosylglycohydrolase
MKTKAQAMLFAAFAADALALPVHWIYDATKLKKDYGRVTEFLKPAEGSYHFGKDRGEFTHYGDQMLVLLESVAASGGFRLDDFAYRWRQLFTEYRGYVDGATRVTLENFARGEAPEDGGSSSNDLAGAARIVPLVLCYRDDLDALVRAARMQTQMTHNHPEVVEAADFFARVLWHVLQGRSPVAAIQDVSANVATGISLAEWMEEGRQLMTVASVTAIGGLGQSCSAPHAFPAVIQLIARHQNNLAEALVENVMAGGDSAGRGILVGAVLGAHLGWTAIPTEWIDGLKSHETISKLAAAVEVRNDAEMR